MKKLGKITSILFVCMFVACAVAYASEGGTGSTTGIEQPKWDLFKVDTGLMVWTVISFLILLIVLWKFAWKPMQGMLDKRTESIDGNIKEAEATREEAQTYLDKSKASIDEAKKEAQERVDEAKRDAEVLKTEIMNQANTDADAERNRGSRDAEMFKDKAFEEFWKEAAEVTTALAGKIIQKSIKPKEQSALVDGFIEEYKKVKK